ncbi:MAG: DUF4430 domain-containing protein [Eubacteriales bacterium]
MKYKLLAGFFCLLILLSSLGTMPVSAESNKNTVDAAQSLIDGIVAYKLRDSGASDLQEWIDGTLTKNAGVSSEWYVLTLSQYGTYNFSAYEANLLAYLSENEVYSASSRLKYALCLAAVGSTDSYISSALNDSIGRQGIMSLICGLHLLNNGYVSSEYTADEVVTTLLSLQCNEGGWSLTGQYADIDVTAMTVQALAPHYSESSEVKTAVDQALALLSNHQLEDGDYSSYGVPNPESTAQVLVALSSLGIDCQSDTRFIKNGNTLFDGIEKYLLSDGSFSHIEGGGPNETATVQIFYGLVSYLRMKNDKTPLYILDNANPSKAEPAPITPSAEVENNNDTPATKEPWNYKPWICLIMVGLGGVACLVLFLVKKRHVKNFIAVLIIVGLAVCLICVTDFRSTDDYYNGESVSKENIIGTVTLTIRCDTIVRKSESEYIPDDGIILDITEFEIEDGDTVYDILIEAARKYNIRIENDGNAEMAYISGINYLYEFDFGDLSGWVYHVNGVAPSVGCGEYKLSDGDTVEWLYTCNLGNDLK